MDQKPNKATFVSRDVQSSAQLHIGQTEPQEKQEAPLFFDRESVRERHARTYRSSFHAQRTKKPYRKQTTKETSTYKSRAIRRIAICCAMAIGCVGLKYIKLPFAEQATDFLKNAFTYDLDIEESIGKLHFVEKIFPDVKAVFGDRQQFSYPVSGAIIQKFGEDGKEYIQFQAEPKAEVVCALDGQVEKRGINDTLGKYLKIRHANNLTTVYYGMEESPLAEGAEVTQGQALGTLGDNGLLCFQVLSGDAAQDPQKYLGVK